MNCKSGDLAMVMRGFPELNRGRVIRVTTVDVLVGAVTNTPMWRYEGDLDGQFGGRCACIADACLRPIRDPGDDEVDEIVKKLGAAPKTLTEVREVSHG
jgi:hypothetical protein